VSTFTQGLKHGWLSQGSGQTKFGIRRFLNFGFDVFWKKSINQDKICKKIRSNSKVTGEELFFKTKMFGWLKFKFVQIS
jgi:hypothetical protein